MKTQTATAEAPVTLPGNLSTRQLAKSLMKAPATTETKETDTAEAETEATTREQSPADKAKSKETAGAHAEAETEETTETPESAETDAADTGAAEETTETTNAEETNGTEETPASISEEVSKRLHAELGPLMEELKQAGAKGALQILQKRIPKLTDQRDTERNGRLAAEEANKQLRAELQSAKTQKPETGGPSANGMVHPRVAAVEQELANVDYWIGYCEANLPKLESEDVEAVELPNGKGGKVRLNAAQLKALQKKMEQDRTELVAERKVVERETKAEWQEKYNQSHTEAVSQYAWLGKKESPEMQEMQSILQAVPVLKYSHTHELDIADMFAGRALRLARAKTKANGAAPLRKATPSREPTKVATDAPGGGADGEVGDKELKAAEAKFRQTGKTTDLAKLNAAKARVNRAKTK